MGKTMGKKIAVFMIIFAILLSWDGVAYAAKVNFYNSSIAELDKINFNNLSTNNGLTSDLITYIYQDSIGYMWIGTKDGLNQYNGNMVVQYTYQYGNEKSLTSPCITSINEDDSGNIWVGTDSGLNIINRDEDKVIRIESGEQNEDMLSNYVITSIYKDSYGVMWVGTTNGLNRYDEKNNKFIKYYSDGTNTNITNNYITDIDENELGELWVSTMDGISIIDLKTYSIRNRRDKYNNIEYIYSVDKDNYGDMWVLGKESVFKIINKDYEVGIYNIYDCENLSGNMTKVLCHSNGDVWLSRGTGLIRYTLSSNETKIYTETSNYLISNSISCLYEDKSGVLWVGTNKGVSILNTKQQFSTRINNILIQDQICGKSVKAFLQDGDNDLWIGMEEGGLIQFDISEDKTISFIYDEDSESSLLSNSIKYIMEGVNGNIIVSTEKGINIINKNTKEIISYPYEEINLNLLLNDNFKIVNDDKYSWSATEEGLYRYNRETNEVVNYRENFNEKGISNYKIFDIYQDEIDENILWLAGGKEGGLIKFHKTEGVIKNYLSTSGENSLSYDSINCIQGDGKGKLWIGTEVGLNKFNIEKETFTQYYDKDGLVSNYINSIIIDDNENIWLGTNKGLSKFIINENRFINFTERDGVSGNQFNKRAAYKTKEGHLLFGTTEGVVSFDPNNIEEITPKVDKVVLDTLLINRELFISDGDNIELNHDENNITIQYFLPNYTRIGSITYLYKMDGVNKEWISDSKGGYATYTMLKPGKYTFRVKAVKSDGSFTEESTVSFVIKKPFWKSNIVYCIFIIVALLIILNIVYRVKFLKKLVDNQTKEINRQLEENKKLYERNIRNEKFKNDYFVNLSHELRTPISIILSVLQLLDSLKENGNVTKERQLHYIDVIRKSSKSLLDIINDIIDSSKIESGTYKINKEKNIDIIYLVEETALNMSDYINSKGIELIIDPEVEELPICCDPNEIQRCIINLIGNAVKFTEENGQIKVLIKADDSNVSISIEDNGLGISKDDQEFIFKRFEQGKNINSTKVSSSGIGLTLVKYIVELHDGHVKLESELNKGSKFTIVLPIN